MSGKFQNNLNGLLLWALVLASLFIFISVSVTQIFLAAALVLWIVVMIRDKQRPIFPAFFWALLVYVGLSLAACVMSNNQAVSFRDSKEMLLFLVVPMMYMSLKENKDIKKIHWTLLASAFLSMIFSLFYFLFLSDPGERIAGFMGHYMTQAGLLMLFSALALSRFFAARGRLRFIWGGGFGLASVALVLTLTRNAWIGLLIVVCITLFFYRPKILILLPIALVVGYFIAPSSVKHRALSIFNPQSYSNAQRIEYLQAGIKIIKDNPLFGTGPNTVHVIFQNPKYGLSEEARNNVHLHNNLIQIAAERGIPTLLAWGTFMIWTLVALIGQLKQLGRSKGQDPLGLQITVCALSCVVALAAAGLFEYNFGDSEVTTLFLYLITIPFAYSRFQAGMNPDKE